MIKQFDLEIFPCKLWVSINEPSDSILDKFNICRNDDFYEIDESASYDLYKYIDTSEALTMPVKNKKDRNIGALMYFPSKKIKSSAIAHESVHVADYIFDLIGANTESFEDGNELYAYTVGWASNCAFNCLNRG